MKPVKAQPKFHARGVVFEEVLTVDLEEDEVLSEPKTKITSTRKSKYVTAFSLFDVDVDSYCLQCCCDSSIGITLVDHPYMWCQITQMTRTTNWMTK